MVCLFCRLSRVWQDVKHSPRRNAFPVGSTGLLLAVSCFPRFVSLHSDDSDVNVTEFSTGRMYPRVGSGRVGSRFCRILAGQVGSGQHLGFFSFLFIISQYLNR